MKPWAVLVNPSSGRGRGGAMAARITQALRESGIEFRYFETEKSGDATSITEAFPLGGYDRLLVVGGDGTINEAVKGLRDLTLPLALFPAGTGNDAARFVGIQDEATALKTAFQGAPRKIDLGWASGDHFVNIYSFGLDAAIATQANRWKHLLPGWVLYPAALVKTILSFQPPRVSYTLTTPAGEIIHRKETILLMAICNGSHYGGGMQINPAANPRDGIMELCVVREMPRWKLLLLFPTVYKGTHVSFREVTIEKITSMSFKAEKPSLLNRDGETWPGIEAAIRIIPEGLTVLCPVSEGISTTTVSKETGGM
ncbi:diacylglycerol kinase family protein [Anoxynatronum sibiricum]|uniref:Diacylglycerol kinase family protein n=1 Tax=Anoxynatronum sibiricum TaxID=210623 RepID=A0ABU9VSI9_9CLOT